MPSLFSSIPLTKSPLETLVETSELLSAEEQSSSAPWIFGKTKERGRGMFKARAQNTEFALAGLQL